MNRPLLFLASGQEGENTQLEGVAALKFAEPLPHTSCVYPIFTYGICGPGTMPTR
jgi:hypothetical protein